MLVGRVHWRNEGEQGDGVSKEYPGGKEREVLRWEDFLQHV